MSKNLIVTLANKNYIDQAKQLFSSVYFNAGWQGDYMLLAHDLEEDDVAWFKDKNILVKHCQPLHNDKINGYSPVVLSKLYLFTNEFKKWDNIIFLDSDIIVQASLDQLIKVSGLAAVSDVFHNLKNQFINYDNNLFNQLKSKYDFTKPSFNVGVLAFNTSIITDNTFIDLKKFIKDYKKIIAYPEQAILNLYFYNHWQQLPLAYNIFCDYYTVGCRIKPQNLKGINLHFTGSDPKDLPWNQQDYFYQKWQYNLKKAEDIDLNIVLTGNKWSKLDINKYSRYLKFKHRTIFVQKGMAILRSIFRRLKVIVSNNY